MTISKELLDELPKGCERPEDLLGNDGLMKKLKVRLMERMLGAELTAHLGYEDYTIGWAIIYSVPTWMKQTEGTIAAEIAVLQESGLVDSLMITDAQGNAQTQIQQIQSMIDADIDAIIVIAGSATVLDRVIEDACAAGIAVVNFDSLVTTGSVTAKINTDTLAWGEQAAQWMVDQLGGEGNIIVMNGPAGVSGSGDRRAGATPVLEANPGLVVLSETNTEYNVAPAQEAMTSLLFANPEIEGNLS